MFEKRKWVPTHNHPGASDLNRIEDGIADNDAVNGIATVDYADNQDNVDNQEQKEGE